MNATPIPKLTDIFDRAIELIEQGWTQGWYARDMRGHRLGSREAGACCWCLTGALNRAGAESCAGIYLRQIAYAAAERHIPTHGCSLQEFNDTPGRTKEEVLAVLRAARNECAADAEANTRLLEGPNESHP